MSSFLIITIAVLLNTVNKLYTKFAITNTGSFSFLLAINVVATILSLPFFLLNLDKFYQLSFWQIIFMLFVGGLWSVNGYLSHLTIDNSEVSVREPLTQLQIIWAVIIGFIFFNERINLQIFSGIFLIILSGLVLVYRKDFFSNLSKERHLGLIIFYTIFTASVASSEKFVMSFTVPEVFMFFSYLMTSLSLIPFIKVNSSEMKSAFFKKGILIWGGVLTFATYIVTLYVYKNFDLTLAYPLLKIATPLTAILGILLFNERSNLLKKIIALLLVIAGVFLIKL